MTILGLSRTSSTAIAAAGLGVALAGCGASSSGSGAAPANTLAPAAAPASATNVSITTDRSGSFGQILVAKNGVTLYEFTPDKQGTSVCTGQCASVWPPLTVAKGAHVVAGAGVGRLSTITRADGSEQAAINGHPLYEFAGDKAAGQTKGEGVEGTWFVVSPTGAMIRHAATTASTTAPSPAPARSSAPAGGSGGYGY